MRSLPPIINGVEGNHLQLQKNEGVDFEFLGYLLSCHLVIEHYLDEFLMTLGTKLRWEAAKLTFSQKTSMFPPDLFPHGAETIAAIRHLNSLRNKVAHNIKVKAVDLDFEPFNLFLSLTCKGKKSVPTEPIAVLEDFTSLVCSGFAGWVASDAYRTTWRHERRK
ncbi:hypothetical protein BVZ31_04715 [Alcaligenes faecalis]|uniref:hypothetical protein n=1 Tax=Alcaligenes faecalis TaxID=511 RepID=UPI000A2EA3A5|nr:hypothetical protein [Alcaligenes faecalis]MBW4788827.1 hypothetical protein [Alcaligenes faecalis subsp. faecalis]OSZ43559.1 hypothetical protein BVZ30_09860 [Alcaligenes faecalis]OSZ51547.1 hypothetical protein BVZ31_04715 [Alcaligenes faecalis]OSZ55048.1 hypothetical protein BVZ32_00950 [Alcaligenes faecalis]